MLESEQATEPSHPETGKIRDQLGTHTQHTHTQRSTGVIFSLKEI